MGLGRYCPSAGSCHLRQTLSLVKLRRYGQPVAAGTGILEWQANYIMRASSTRFGPPLSTMACKGMRLRMR
jgi:hypothetical protein